MKMWPTRRYGPAAMAVVEEGAAAGVALVAVVVALAAARRLPLR